MSKPNNADAFKIQYRMLKLSGAWPENDATFWYKFRGILLFLFPVALSITMLMEAYDSITDFGKLSEILYIMITIITYLFKHMSFFFQSETFIRLINQLKDPIFTSYPDDLDKLMHKTIRISQLIANAYRYLVFGAIFLVTIAPFIDKRALPFPFPYDLEKFTYFFFCFQSFSAGMVGWNNSCHDSLAASFVNVATTQLMILGNKIDRVRNEGFSLNTENDDELSTEIDSKVQSNLRQCVDHHLAIIELVSSINQVFSVCILIQFLGSIIIICNTLFHFLLITPGSSQFFMLVNYLATMISQLFLYCWFGDDVIWKSAEIGNACYKVNWYNCGTEVRKPLFFIMERSRRPLTINVAKFSVLSLNSFLTILQWSYSYFALLMKLYYK